MQLLSFGLLQICENSMASSSRTPPPQTKPDVFVNFRGEDTRESFVSHFRRATEQNGIFAFTDEGLRGGDNISTTLANKILGSQVAVVVFSPNYANSRWCLDELVHIVQCKQQKGQTVIPVFLQGVKPTHVRHQTGRFGDGFKESAGRYPDKKDAWIHALKQTADLSSGVFDHSSEAEIVDRLINTILSFLGKIGSHDYDWGYFGKHRIEEVKSRLSSQHVNSIGIWGMGGSGKTTLARKVFDHISNNFAGVCFLENVRDRAEKAEYNQLQEQMICQLLGKADRNVSPRTIYDNQTMFRLSRISVLIVLDDVSDVGQVEKVIGDWRNYGRGSKMIATSRDMQVLKNMCDDVYEVEMLDANDSLQLLQHHMFKRRQPTMEQLVLLRQTRQYAQGLPLSLVILGRRLYDKNVITWRSDLENLRNCPDIGLTKILRSSFDELDDIHKSMFLDIACLLHCSDGDCMEIILKTCGFGSISIIDRLIDKALITINRYNELHTHDLLQQMGDEIGKHSRLWKWKEIADVLSSSMDTSRIEVISPEMSIGKKVKLQPDVFKDMGRLRIICLRKGCAENILMSQGLKYLPNDLRYLEWNNYPSPSFPSHIDLENLVELRMRDSNLKKLWSGKLCLPNLKCIDLSYSKNLSQLPDLSGALKLETLELRLCGNVQDTHVSVKHLAELKHLDLSFTGLTRCPDLSKFKKLEHLALESCGKITELQQLPKSLIHINLIHTNIKELPRGIQKLSQLTQLLCQGCEELESLPSNIGELQYLEELDISFCLKIRSLPTSVGDLHSLVKLSTFYSGLTCLPEEIENLANLRELDMSYCTNLKTLPDGIKYLANLKELRLSNCTNLESLPDGIGLLYNLEKLVLSYCINLISLPDGIENLSNLKELLLCNCTNLKGFPDGIELLANLEVLDLSGCTNLKSLPDGIEYLANLKELQLSNCTNLEILPDGIGLLSNLEVLSLSGCTNLKSLPDGIEGLDKLEELYLSNCTNLESLPDGIEYLAKLKGLQLYSCTNLEYLPDGIGGLANLKTLYLFGCTNLESLPDGIELLSNLEVLDLSSCTNLMSLPDGIENLASLKELRLRNCTYLKSLPDGIELLANLVELDLSCCTDLESIPDGIDGLAKLENLRLSNCTNLKSLPDGIEGLANLKELDMSYCTNLESLPDGIENLANLEELQLFNCTNLESLPEGIVWPDNQRDLYLSGCTNLVRLPEGIEFSENLTKIILISCTKLESLPEGIKYLTHLTKLDLSGCSSLRMIPELPCKLGDLNATNCTSLIKYAPMLSPGPCRGFWFRFSNCMSLQGDAMNHIFGDFILAIPSVLKMSSQYNIGTDDNEEGIREVELVLPGSEFPEGWFNNYSSGGEIGCKPLLANTNWRSVADPVVALIFGVVLAFLPIPNFLVNHFRVKCEWRSESGQVLCSKSLDTYGITIPGECTVFWLQVVNPSMFCFPKTSFHFSVYNGWSLEELLRDDVEILKCGVAPINGSSYTMQ